MNIQSIPCMITDATGRSITLDIIADGVICQGTTIVSTTDPKRFQDIEDLFYGRITLPEIQFRWR